MHVLDGNQQLSDTDSDLVPLHINIAHTCMMHPLKCPKIKEKFLSEIKKVVGMFGWGIEQG